MSTLGEEYRNLVYKLCEQRDVPVLVTDVIAECLDKSDLPRINILSRDLNVQANAAIYRNIVVNLEGSERSIQKSALLFRTLLTSKTAASAVRTLSLAGEPLLSWRKECKFVRGESDEYQLRGKTPPDIHTDPTDFTQGEIELYDKVAAFSSARKRPPISEVSVWALCLYILRLTSYIQDLSVSSDYFRFPIFRDILRDMDEEGFFQKLQSSNLGLDLLDRKRRHATVVRDWDNALLIPFMAPDVKSIALVVSLKLEAHRQLRPGGFSITRLILHHYQIHESELSALLAATPKLQYLE